MGVQDDSGNTEQRPVPQVGQQYQAERVTAPVTLGSSGVRLVNDKDGIALVVSVEVRAAATVTAYVLATEQVDSKEPEKWPRIDVDASLPPGSKLVDPRDGAGQLVRLPFNQLPLPLPDILFSPPQKAQMDRRWPIMVSFATASNDGVPDGSVLVFGCMAQRGFGRVECVAQIVAFGGMAYPMKLVYGLGGSEENCAICLTDKKDTAILPCGHLCLCAECGRRLKLTPSRAFCPLCRAQVNEIVTLDIAAEEAPAATEDCALSQKRHRRRVRFGKGATANGGRGDSFGSLHRQ